MTSVSDGPASGEGDDVETKRCVDYEEDRMLIGWLEEFPDYRTQGETLDELRENLKDIYGELTSGRIPAVDRIGELVIG